MINFEQVHRMVGTRANVFEAVLFHLSLETGLTVPVGVLATVVDMHLTGKGILCDATAVGPRHVGGCLTKVSPKAVV